MLMWRKEGIFTVGATERYAHAVVLSDADKEAINVSSKLTPDELRQVADKLEELQGKKEETGKVLWLQRREDGKVHYVIDTNKEKIGYFTFRFDIDREEFKKTVERELSPAEVAAIKHFDKVLNPR